MRKQKIIILCEAGMRFVYPQVPDLAELLARDHHEVEVIGPIDPEAAKWNAGRGFVYIEVTTRKGPGWLYNLRFIFGVLNYCRKADKVIVCTTVSLSAGLLAKLLYQKSYAFYALECQIPGESSSGFYAWIQIFLRFSKPLVVATGYHRAKLMQRYLCLVRRPSVVENMALLNTMARDQSVPRDVRTDTKILLGCDPGFLVVLNGGLGSVNAIEAVLAALATLPKNVTIAMFGPVEEHILPQIKEQAMRYKNVVYLGTIPGGRKEIITYLKTADAGLVFKYRGRGYCFNDRFYTPNKIYDFIAASVPVICSPNLSMKHLVRNRMAFVLDRLLPSDIVNAIAHLSEMPAIERNILKQHITYQFNAFYNFERASEVLREFCRN